MKWWNKGGYSGLEKGCMRFSLKHDRQVKMFNTKLVTSKNRKTFILDNFQHNLTLSRKWRKTSFTLIIFFSHENNFIYMKFWESDFALNKHDFFLCLIFHGHLCLFFLFKCSFSVHNKPSKYLLSNGLWFIFHEKKKQKMFQNTKFSGF